MKRENVREHFSHWEKPSILRIMCHDGDIHREKLRERMQTVGFRKSDVQDIRWVIEHWKIIRLAIELEPHDDLITISQCDKNLLWMETNLQLLETS